MDNPSSVVVAGGADLDSATLSLEHCPFSLSRCLCWRPE
jgi:hypothetical protein